MGRETITVRGGQRGRHAGAKGERARQVRAEDRENWGPLVGHVQHYREGYKWEGAD